MFVCRHCHFKHVNSDQYNCVSIYGARFVLRKKKKSNHFLHIEQKWEFEREWNNHPTICLLFFWESILFVSWSRSHLSRLRSPKFLLLFAHKALVWLRFFWGDILLVKKFLSDSWDNQTTLRKSLSICHVCRPILHCVRHFNYVFL